MTLNNTIHWHVLSQIPLLSRVVICAIALALAACKDEPPAAGPTERGESAITKPGPSRATSPAGTLTATRVTAGGTHTCALANDGSAWCWGANSSGQLGDGTEKSATKPTRVQGLKGAVVLTAGLKHSCAIVNGGAVKCWGDNESGQVGAGGDEVLSPVAVAGVAGARSLALGESHSCALLGDGGVTCWGDNSAGQLGAPTREKKQAAAPVSGIADAKQVVAGRRHSCALLGDGTVKCWGSDERGQLGDGDGETKEGVATVTGLGAVKAIGAGQNHNCALEKGGKVWCWGRNYWGQLGDGKRENRVFTPVAVSRLQGAPSALEIGGEQSCVVVDGTVRCWGHHLNRYDDKDKTMDHSGKEIDTVPELRGVTALSVGAIHACAVAGGELHCWGKNFGGRLGDGTTTPSPVPHKVNLGP